MNQSTSSSFGHRANRTGASRCKHRLATVLISSTILGSTPLFVPSLAHSQQQTASQASFDIPAQSLSSAINAFIRTTGWEVGFTSEAVAGKRSSPVSGSMVPAQALQTLLSGTGVSARISGPSTAALVSGDDRIAQAFDLPDDGSTVLDLIRITGGGNPADLPYSTPGSSTYISAEQLDRVPAITPGDIFRGVPGLDVRGNHNGTGVDVSIRGMNGHNRVNVMVEGTQQQSSSTQGYTGPDNQTHIDQDLISSVSVKKGPQTGPYSAGAIGGVVNVETLQAGDILLPGKEFGVRLRGGALGNVTSNAPAENTNIFNYDRPSFFDMNGLSGSVAGAFRNENVELVAAYSKRKKGNYFAGNHGDTHYGPNDSDFYSPYLPGAEVFNTSEDTDSLLLKGKFEFADGHSLEAGYLKTVSEYGWTYPISITLPGGLSQKPLEELSSERYWTRYKWNPAENDFVNFQANLWGTELEKKYRVADTRNWGFEAWNESIGALSFGGWKANYGLSYARENVVQDNNLLNNRGQREVGTAFLNTELDIHDTVSLSAGLQYTTFSSNSRYSNTSGGIENPELSGNALSPSASITYKPLPGIQLFASYAEGYRPPSARETAPLNGYEYNLDLLPEKSTNWEFGGNVIADSVFVEGDSLKLKAAYFMNDYEDYIAMQGLSFFGPYFQNIPGAKIDGIELSGSYKNSSFFIDASLNYYTRFDYCFGEGFPFVEDFYKGCTEYLSGGSMVTAAISPPKYSGSVTVGTTLLDDALTIGTSARFFSDAVGSRTLPNGNLLFVRNFWRPDVIVDVFGSYEFSENLRADFSVENVFDRFYVDPMLIAKNPSPGRTFRASLTAKF